MNAYKYYLDGYGSENRVYRTLNDERFAFDRVSSDGEMATFKILRPEEVDDQWPKEHNVLRRLGEDDAEKEMLVKPTQVVIIRGHVGDIYLPGLQVDVEEMTMEFDWKMLFSLFFAEGGYPGNYTIEWSKCVSKIWLAKRKVRRSRLQHLYPAITGHELVLNDDYLLPEKAALASIRNYQLGIDKGRRVSNGEFSGHWVFIR
ncbi:hypothetical protein OEA41_010826 [Lepraria neglecta]|uniref:Uncharacterized protein n=1 Tax=Lepraria neglecta TaxID=209136 RepID=A0AAD9YX31_9LECA|nr:hypothetical protein OEA41_010826 [Lepraria neglecta]